MKSRNVVANIIEKKKSGNIVYLRLTQGKVVIKRREEIWSLTILGTSMEIIFCHQGSSLLN